MTTEIAIAADPVLSLVAAARAAEEAAKAAARQSGGNVPGPYGEAADDALSVAYRTAPTTLAGIAALASLALDMEYPDTEVAEALRSIVRAASALSLS
ncbi:hypothetical protein [Rhodoblastus sp.]|uniref:hypothetical protein n=1 Tax=Rhodoblastus sp. TaxID=1962975 RepID=UPI00260C6424|nr:hypothetical protein [Rhodoblastus sp.]